MRKLLIALSVLALSSSAIGSVTYTDLQELYSVRPDPSIFSWDHQNPAELPNGPRTPEEYAQAVSEGRVISATLTIVLDSLNQGESVAAWIQDKDDVWHYLGLLETMTISDGSGLIAGAGGHDGHVTNTTFDIEPIWLNGLPVTMSLVPGSDISEPFEVETSTLNVVVTPAPGAALLAGFGVGLVGWLRRRRAF